LTYTQKEWINLSARDKRISVEGLAKVKGIKPGTSVLLDSAMIGTSAREGVVVNIKVNTAYDGEDYDADDIEPVYPSLRDNLIIVVEIDDGKILEINFNEIVKVLRR
jgi:hypothetical protein